MTTISTVAKVMFEVLPHEVEVATPKWRPSAFELRLAQASLAALMRPEGPAAEPTAASYRKRMAQVGLITEGRAIDSMRLQAFVKDSMTGAVFQRILAKSERDLRWIPRLLVSCQCAENPAARHLLFTSLIEAAPKYDTPLLDFTPAFSRRSHMVEMDAKFAAAGKKLVQEAIRHGERVKVSDVLKQVGCWTSFRHHPHDFPKLQAFVVWLKASPAGMRPNWGRGGTPRVRSVMRNKL
ncbi:hypothetical protein [Roseateles cavernae]|uniref:hypothetical protein n=1 Tax=Roseateles cavernae TaxID=3153578 RepID=UPI0032E3A740